MNFDAMSGEEIKKYADNVGVDSFIAELEKCSFACIKRVYEKFFGFRPVSTKKREKVIRDFSEYYSNLRY